MTKQKLISSNLLLIVVVIGLGSCSSKKVSKPTRIPLFDGQTLQGWTVTDCNAIVDQGEILILDGNGLIQTEATYQNFILEFDWKALKEDNWDSGVYFRYTKLRQFYPWPNKYQVNLRKGEEGNVNGLDGATSKGLLKDHTWNQFKLTVQGSQASLEINGQPAWQADGITHLEAGYIGLQAEVPGGGQHRFRSIYLTPIQ